MESRRILINLSKSDEYDIIRFTSHIGDNKVAEKETTTVRVALKFVRNLGNYESVHIELGVEDYVRDTDTNVDTAMNRVYTFVENKLMEKVQEIEQDLKK